MRLRTRHIAGFTYLGLLLLMAIAGIGIAAVGQGWHTEMQREKERELLFIGNQFRLAIGRYYESNTAAGRQYPLTLEELVHDGRLPKVQHHLRKIYTDPMTGTTEWGLEKQEGRIIGVYSLSEQHPLKNSGFEASDESFANARAYRNWQFTYAPGGIGSDVAGGNTPSNPETTTPVPNQTAEDKPTQQQECLAQHASDMAVCTSFCQEHGKGAECKKCQASILSRYKACLSGDSTPALDTGG